MQSIKGSAPIPLILASASPRRRELVSRFWPRDSIQVLLPQLDEAGLIRLWQAEAELDPPQLVTRLSKAKWLALQETAVLPENCLVLTADTAVVVDSQILGKPADADEAQKMLTLLNGRSHQVITALCLAVRLDGKELCLQAAEQTDVWFAPLSKAQIEWYIATGEPFDKAGAYGIQGYGAALIERIAGCYYNVMGLPVYRLMDLLQQTAGHFSSSAHLYHILPWN